VSFWSTCESAKKAGRDLRNDSPTWDSSGMMRQIIFRVVPL
jgi:hypothetical protein